MKFSLLAVLPMLVSRWGLGSPEPTDVVSPSPQQIAWQSPAGPPQIPLWPQDLSIAKPDVDGPESTETYDGPKAPGGIPVTSVHNVTRPTMTIFPAKGRNTGAAVLVFPGGGYQILAIDFEGTEVCDWITAKGVTCIVLKYRVPGSGHSWNDACRCHKLPTVPMALQDAQRAMVLLRHQAKSLGVDPHKIGVLGFSAGGHMVAQVSNADTLAYKPVDAADAESSRPDFGIALYPGHLWSGQGTTLYSFDHISPKAPPTFIVQAEDDPVDDVRHSITYFLALREAKIPVEMHIYAKGGHAFGLRPTAEPITHWPELAEKWLHTIGML